MKFGHSWDTILAVLNYFREKKGECVEINFIFAFTYGSVKNGCFQSEGRHVFFYSSKVKASTKSKRWIQTGGKRRDSWYTLKCGNGISQTRNLKMLIVSNVSL